jgi:hypothetical protein
MVRARFTNQHCLAFPVAMWLACALSAAAQQSAADREKWTPADKPVQHGGIQVRIVRVSQELTPLKDLGTNAMSAEEQLSIVVEITNQSDSQKVHYETWQGKDFSLGRDFASLKDNFGNHYKRITFGLGTKIVGNVESESIYPGKAITDRLVFELPIDTVEHLDLELPASNFDGEGVLRIRIPRKMFAGPDPAELAKQEAERLAVEQAKRRADRERRAAEEEAKFRTWTAASGKSTIEAKLVSYLGGVALLERRDRRRVRVPLEKLSEADQKFVEKWRREKSK